MTLRCLTWTVMMLAGCGDDGSMPTDPDAEVPVPDAGPPAPPVEGEVLLRLDVRNDSVDRIGEIARSAVPLASAWEVRDVSELTVTDAELRPLPAQLRPIARWGGGPDDASLPLRFVEVAVQLDAPADSTTDLRLVRGTAPPIAAPLVRDGATVDTGAAVFELDPSSAALFRSVRLASGAAAVVSGASGPFVVLSSGRRLDVAAVIESEGELVEDGPLRAVFRHRGRFDGGDATFCATGGGYQRFAYELDAIFERGSSDIELRFTLRNECGEGSNPPWTDEAIEISEAGFALALAPIAGVGYGTEGTMSPASGTEIRVEQARGAGAPWVRRARVVASGEVLESAESFASPVAAAFGDGFAASAELAFMRYREPQAVSVREGALVISVVGEPAIVGEAVGLWNHARISIAGSLGELEARARRSHAALERGLLVHTNLEDLGRTGVMLPLAEAGDASFDRAYTEVLRTLHDDTVRPGGQWDRARGFGAQLWPETLFDQYAGDFATPAEHPAPMNYWNPLGAEALEFVRAGDPEMAWTMALPAAWTQAHAAYYNLGARTHSNRNGLAVTSGGGGDGQWHRSNEGSDDYTYCMGLDTAYLIRPEHAFLERLRQGGSTVARRYSVGRERMDERDFYVNARRVDRQMMQHLELLFDCAELVPGADGDECRDRLHEIVEELAADNLSAGVICPADDPADECVTPALFMQSSLIFEIFARYELAYPGRIASLRADLVAIGRNYLEYAVPRRPGGEIDVGGDFEGSQACTLDAAREAVVSCTGSTDTDDQPFIYAPTQPGALAMAFMADAFDPARGSCDALASAFDDPAIDGPMRSWVGSLGYWKGQNQALQNLVYAVGAASSCD